MKLQEAARPLWTFSRVCGLYSGHDSGAVEVAWKLYSLLVFALNFHNLVSYPALDLKVKSDHIVMLTDCLCSVVNNATLLVAIAYNILGVKTIKEVNAKLEELEDTYGRCCDSVRLRRGVAAGLILQVFMWALTLATLRLLYEEWRPCFWDWLEYYFSSYVCDVHTSQFTLFVRVLAKRLGVVAAQLQEAKAGRRLDAVLDAKRHHRAVHQVCGLVEAAYSVPLLFAVANIFVAMFAELYFATNARLLYTRAIFRPSAPADYAVTVAVLLKLVAKLVSLTMACEGVYEAQRKICWALHEAPAPAGDAVFDGKLSELSLQLIHEKIAFTAAGFFAIDNGLLRTVISAVTIYLVILIQFDMTAKA